jgi:6-phosphogluconate dehydrogenase
MLTGIIGIGRMGGGMARRLLAAGHGVVAFDQDATARSQVGGAYAASSISDLVEKLDRPRHVFVMVPPGAPTAAVFGEIAPLLANGDAVADSGNSHFRESITRAEALAIQGVGFLDIGTNSGVDGEGTGYCLSVGGEATTVARFRPLLDALGRGEGRGWRHVGPAGSGHYVKMIHNAILYGLMEAYAEGFALLSTQSHFPMDCVSVADLWSEESLIGSHLLELIGTVLHDDAALETIRGSIDDTGAGRWGALEALELNVSAPVLTDAVIRRIRSREDNPYTDRLLAALRGAFGGHPVARVQ